MYLIFKFFLSRKIFDWYEKWSVLPLYTLTYFLAVKSMLIKIEEKLLYFSGGYIDWHDDKLFFSSDDYFLQEIRDKILRSWAKFEPVLEAIFFQNVFASLLAHIFRNLFA